MLPRCPHAHARAGPPTANRQVHGVVFDSLLCLNNMPIKRFADWLLRQGQLGPYMQLLVEGFNAGAVAGLMCTNTLSVSWDGRLFDCDFNQQLDMPLMRSSGSSRNGAGASASSSADDEAAGAEAAGVQPQQRHGLTVWDIDSLADVAGLLVRTGSHCYGCTAGAGSGCQGATA